MKIACSACLLGHNCKYNGKNNFNPEVAKLAKEHTLIPVCPEVLGGMPVPRVPCERVGDRIIDQDGTDQTDRFAEGAKKALEILEQEGAELVILQPRSPSCGCGQIYDGTFSSTLTKGNGVFAELLAKKGIPMKNAV